MKRKLIEFGMALVVMLSGVVFTGGNVKAMSVDDQSVFLKQQTSSTCTLVSAAMALRRKAIMQNDPEWASITEDSLKAVAWTSGGLIHDFTYSTDDYSYQVSYGDVDDYNDAPNISGTDKVNALVNLLNAHPEGVAIYTRRGHNGYHGARNHCVLLTGYVNGVFYVSDPSGKTAPGPISIDQASTVTVENCASYWYVSKVKSLNSTSQAVTPSAPASAQDLSAASIALSKSVYSYNGKKKNPQIAVTYNGNALVNGTDYTVTYQNNMKSVGTHGIVVSGIGNYTGSLSTSIRIKPKKAKITSLSGKRKSMKVRYAKLSGNVHYQLAYRRHGRVLWNYTYADSSSKTIKHLKSKAKYSVKVRGYRNGVYGSYSKTKTVKAK